MSDFYSENSTSSHIIRGVRVHRDIVEVESPIEDCTCLWLKYPQYSPEDSRHISRWHKSSAGTCPIHCIKVPDGRIRLIKTDPDKGNSYWQVLDDEDFNVYYAGTKAETAVLDVDLAKWQEYKRHGECVVAYERGLQDLYNKQRNLIS